MLKRVIITAFASLVCLALLIGYFYHVGRYAHKSMAEAKCEGIVVTIQDSLENSLISGDEIIRRISPWLGSNRTDSIDIYTLEEMVRSFGEVASAEVYRPDLNHIGVKITQRRPVVRFFSGGRSYYADREGYLFHVGKAIDVPLITGHIPLPKDKSFKGYLTDSEHQWILSAIDLATFVSSDSYWMGSIEQIDVAANGDFVLYTSAGNQKIVFGKATDIAEKFKKLEAYYRNIVPKKGTDKYSVVNLKYKNQIICK